MSSTGTITHEDPTVRMVSIYGVDTVVADDPDTRHNYCLDCAASITPMVAIVILDDEQWDYAADAKPLCPTCGTDDLADVADLDRILEDRARDAYEDMREHIERDEWC